MSARSTARAVPLPAAQPQARVGAIASAVGNEWQPRVLRNFALASLFGVTVDFLADASPGGLLEVFIECVAQLHVFGPERRIHERLGKERATGLRRRRNLGLERQRQRLSHAGARENGRDPGRYPRRWRPAIAGLEVFTAARRRRTESPTPPVCAGDSRSANFHRLRDFPLRRSARRLQRSYHSPPAPRRVCVGRSQAFRPSNTASADSASDSDARGD